MGRRHREGRPFERTPAIGSRSADTLSRTSPPRDRFGNYVNKHGNFVDEHGRPIKDETENIQTRQRHRDKGTPEEVKTQDETSRTPPPRKINILFSNIMSKGSKAEDLVNSKEDLDPAIKKDLLEIIDNMKEKAKRARPIASCKGNIRFTGYSDKITQAAEIMQQCDRQAQETLDVVEDGSWEDIKTFVRTFQTDSKKSVEGKRILPPQTPESPQDGASQEDPQQRDSGIQDRIRNLLGSREQAGFQEQEGLLREDMLLPSAKRQHPPRRISELSEEDLKRREEQRKNLWGKIEQFVSPELQKGLKEIYESHDLELEKELKIFHEDFLKAYGTTKKTFVSENDPISQSHQALNEILDETRKIRAKREREVIKREISAILENRERHRERQKESVKREISAILNRKKKLTGKFKGKFEAIPSIIPSMIEKQRLQEDASLPETLAKLRDAFRGIRERFSEHQPEIDRSTIDEHQPEIDPLGSAASHNRSENDLEKEGEDFLTPMLARHNSSSDLGEEVEKLELHDSSSDPGEEVEKLKSYESQTCERYLELSRAYEDARTKAREAYYERMNRSKSASKPMADSNEEAEEFFSIFDAATRESEAKVSSHETINTMREEQKKFEEEITAILNQKMTLSRKMTDLLLVRRQQIETEKRGHLAAMEEIHQAECASKDASWKILAYIDARDAISGLEKYKAFSLEKDNITYKEDKDFLSHNLVEHDSLVDFRDNIKKLKLYESQTREEYLELSRAFEDERTKARNAYYERMGRSKITLKLAASSDEEAKEFFSMFDAATRESEAEVSSHETINIMQKEQKGFEEKITAIPDQKTTLSKKRTDLLLVRKKQIETEKRGHLAAMGEIHQAECDSKDALEVILAHVRAKNALADLDKI